MHILAINGSPHLEKGNTHLIMDAFLKGAKEEGALVEYYFLSKLKINPCKGCYTCWIKTEGICVQKDDMEILTKKLKEADLLVLGTPLYVDGVSAQTKLFMDRMLALMKPYFSEVDGHCRHLLRSTIVKNFYLIATCGFYELDNFDPLVTHMKAFCKNFFMEYLGALLRPGAHILRNKKIPKDRVDLVLEAARNAGKELVKKKQVSQKLADEIASPIVSKQEFINLSNEVWKKLLSRYNK